MTFAKIIKLCVIVIVASFLFSDNVCTIIGAVCVF